MHARRGMSSPHALAGLTLCLAAISARSEAQAAPASLSEQPARAARALPRGTVLTADDIMILGDSMPSLLPLGWVTRRVVQSGEALRPPAIGRAPVIQNGGSVNVRADRSRISIQRSGVALEAGAPGDTIRVRLDRAATITAIVRDSANVVPVAPFRP